MKAIVVQKTGGADTLQLSTSQPRPTLGANQCLVRVAAAGVNFIDVYHRQGIYPLPTPFIPGREGAGVVEEVGAECTFTKVGDHVAWFPAPGGSYAQYVVLSAEQCFPLPPDLPLQTAAAAVVQGLTAHYLCNSVYPVKRGDWVLIHAAAGGVGLLLTQMCVTKGAQVIGTVGSAAKVDVARTAGCAHVIRYDEMSNLDQELPAAVRAIVPQGVHVVFDGVGKVTFSGSMASLRVRGMMALFGAASGQVPPMDLQLLNKAGSLFITRPTLGHFMATPEERAWRTGELFSSILKGELKVSVGATFPLEQVAEAHRALEGRKTTGKVLLYPME